MAMPALPPSPLPFVPALPLPDVPVPALLMPPFEEPALLPPLPLPPPPVDVAPVLEAALPSDMSPLSACVAQPLATIPASVAIGQKGANFRPKTRACVAPVLPGERRMMVRINHPD
jgi:hypothetical protein